MAVSEEQRAHLARAEARARATLKDGDRVRVRTCGGGHSTYTFIGWDGRSLLSKSGHNELSPYNVTKLNGKPISFRDDPEAHMIEEGH